MFFDFFKSDIYYQILQTLFFLYIRGKVKPQFFLNAVEKREQYSLRSNFLVFEKIGFYLFQ